MDKTPVDAASSDDKYELICGKPLKNAKIIPDETAETIRKMKLEIDQLKKGQRLLEKKIDDIVHVENKENTEPTSTDTQLEGKEGSDSNPPCTVPDSNVEAPKGPTNIKNDMGDTDLTQRRVTLTRGDKGLFGIYWAHDCVISVIPGSSADLNGLRRGDQLIFIDGVRFEHWTSAFLDMIKSRDTITLGVRYNPKQLEAEERRLEYFYFARIFIVVLAIALIATLLM